ncbi:hypothetical protein GY21_06105 [Cryobacterium roopkundense]|uniref:Lactose phosphotransferase system repressor n=1 Tax=Cryobacterium roopkundense TaxID=1001240 RepID=A0A099JLW9_9MICO|nr:DeoR/GlpR family DNA-binding transcription regulator [Cryobacterium roopkundense]KGJ79100.1 hypothetical protein GY21_06105 [Cryobacterium roopkundense]MBB5643284.1 DeoR family fructose operon transcriptional repressor [Cryobacterium roopkundense]
MAKAAENDGTAPGRAAQERRNRIMVMLREAGRVDVGEVAESLAVADETVRRDLRALEDEGQLRRAHGGAILASALTVDLPQFIAPDLAEHPVASRAAELLPAAGIVFIDSGAVAEALAALVPNTAELQVVTTSIPVALVASRHPDLVVYNLGGAVNPRDDSQSGQWTREALEHIRIDTAFLSVSGISSDGYLLAADPKAARIKSAVVAASERVVLIAEHGQLERNGMVKFAQLSELDHLVVDARTSDVVLSLAADAGVPVLVAEAAT